MESVRDVYWTCGCGGWTWACKAVCHNAKCGKPAPRWVQQRHEAAEALGQSGELAAGKVVVLRRHEVAKVLGQSGEHEESGGASSGPIGRRQTMMMGEEECWMRMLSE